MEVITFGDFTVHFENLIHGGSWVVVSPVVIASIMPKLLNLPLMTPLNPKALQLPMNRSVGFMQKGVGARVRGLGLGKSV